MQIDRAALDTALQSLIAGADGPGGVVGVVHDGQVIHRQAWGFADLTRRIAMTPATELPICSITKQFTCALVHGLAGDPAAWDDRVAAHLPKLKTTLPTIAQLANNQSGLRDTWALTVLHGAQHDGVFSEGSAGRVLAAMRSTHFAPGSQYSYSNGNFHILGELAEAAAGRRLAEVYRDRLFDVAGMATARLAADTSQPLNGAVGYEGTETLGFFPALNRIHWKGDAGIAATIDDMLAWECFIDRTRDDPAGIYARLTRPQTFADGRPATYGNGLRHDRIGAFATTGHGGALRGFRAHRLHVGAARLSVVVLFNHEGSAREAAITLAAAALGQVQPMLVGTAPDWAGAYLDGDSGLLLRITAEADHLGTEFGGLDDRLALGADGTAASPDMALCHQGQSLHIDRAKDGLRGLAHRLAEGVRTDIAGLYHAPEPGTNLSIVDSGGRFFAAFEGFLGQGGMHPMRPVGADVWALSCTRSMDAPAPGTWTVQVRRDGGDRVAGLTLGCWLARKIDYVRDGAAAVNG